MPRTSVTSPVTLTRRRLLSLAGGYAGIALLTACGGSAAATPLGSASAALGSARLASSSAQQSVTTAATSSASTTSAATSAVSSAALAAAVGSGAARTLTIWHIWNGTREPLMKKIAADFTAQHPALAVEEVVITTDLLTKITAGIAAGAPCDMGMINQGWVPALGSQSALEPLDPLVAKNKVDLSVFYAAALAPGKWQGKLYVLPNLGSGAFPVLFYNTDLFRQQGIAAAPATWAELQDAAEKLTVKQGATITQLGGIPAYADNTANFVELLYANSGTLLSADNRTYQFNDAPGLDALTFMQGFFDTMGGWTAQTAFAKNQGTGEKNTPFFKGTQAMDISGIWYVFEIKNDNPQLAYAVAPAPHGPQAGAKYQSPNAGTWAYGIPKGVKSVDDAWLLTQWYTMSQDAGWFMQQQLRPSPLKAVNADPYYQQQTARWPEIVKLLPDTVAVGPTPVDPQVNKLFGTMMGDIIAKKVDPKAALETTQKQAQALLDQWYARHPGV